MSYKSVWDFGRGGVTNYSVHGIGEYPTKIRPLVVAKILERFSEPSDVILDPFCGSGTIAVEAKLQGRHSVNYDVNPKAVELTRTKLQRLDRAEMDAAIKFLIQEATKQKKNTNKKYEIVNLEKEIKKLRGRLEELDNGNGIINQTEHETAVCDARSLALSDGSVDAVITDIPYTGMVEYSEIEGDLSNLDYEGFLVGIADAFSEVHRVLKKGKYFCLFIADYRIGASRKIIPVHADAIKITEDMGFSLFDLYVWRYYRSGSFRPFGKPPYQAMNVHSYILCFYKPTGDEKEKPNRPIRYRPRLKEKLANNDISERKPLFE
jgi:DNA modification methylase